jgi:(S)-2-hydroxyglutarate dehydrogenase
MGISGATLTTHLQLLREAGPEMKAEFDVAIVGAGIVGLATAMELVRDLKVVVLDKEATVAAHQSGHNSGVVHAGLYYKPGSLKAQTAAEGARQMIAFCQEHNLPYELCGKVVVALSEADLPRLEELYRRGTANGVSGLRKLTAAEIRELEPHAAGIAGLHSPRTGIVDYVAVTRTFAQVFVRGGGEIRLDTKVTAIERRPGELVIKTDGNEVHARSLVNCAGLQCDQIAEMTGSSGGLRIIPFRGEYYELTARCRELVRALIYPVPDPGFPFLGVHFTKRINGSIEAGPNAVLAFAREGYTRTSLNPGFLLGLAAFPGFWRMAARYWKMGVGEFYRSWVRPAFVKALQKLMPELRPEDITARGAGAGVRAQAVDSRGNLLDDFSFIEAENAIHVMNAPSPAATAAIAIGQEVARRARATFRLAE